jgi:hypothetical protein
MDSIKITPDFEKATPSDLKPDVPKDLHEAMRVAAATANLLDELGIPFEMSKKDEDEARQLIQATERSKIVPDKVYTEGVAVKLAALLNEYDKQIIADSAQVRTYVTNKLLDISHCGDVKHELRALEMLGKISDVGLFSEKSEITIHAKTTIELESAIKEKINRLLHAKEVDGEIIEDNELDVLEKKVTPKPIVASEIEALPPVEDLLPHPEMDTDDEE